MRFLAGLLIFAACGDSSPVTVTAISMTGADGHVYIVEDHDNVAYILAQPAGGGESVVLAQGPGDAIFAPIATDGAFVYYSFNDESNRPQSIMRVPVAGGTPTLLAMTQPVLDLRVDDTNVYWTTVERWGNYAGSVLSVPKAGGEIATLKDVPTEQPFALTLTATDVLFATSTSSDNGREGDGHIYRVAKTGGATVPIAIGAGYAPVDLATDGQFVYWGDSGFENAGVPRNFGSGGIARADLATGEVTMLADDVPAPDSLIIDGSSLYFTEDNEQGAELITSNAAVDRLPLAGGPLEQLATMEFPHGLVVDDTWVVYLSGWSGDTTGRVAK